MSYIRDVTNQTVLDYIECREQVKALTARKKELEAEILGPLTVEEKSRVELRDLGVRMMVQPSRPSYEYSPLVQRLADHLKELKKTEERSGVAILLKQGSHIRVERLKDTLADPAGPVLVNEETGEILI